MDKLKERFESTQATTIRAITIPSVQSTAAQTLDINELVKASTENAMKAMTTPNNRQGVAATELTDRMRIRLIQL